MALVRNLRISLVGQTAGRLFQAGKALTTAVMFLVGLVGSATAQTPGIHYLQSGDMPPGAIGRWQLTRGGPLPGYFQPVEISAPVGALISLAVEGHLDDPQPAPRAAAMLIGSVYRIKVTGIDRHPDVEVYPTIELINRIYPPPGLEGKFPVQIDLTTEELLLAAQGNMVTRVIYLEDPKQAMPAQQVGGRQSWFEAAPGDDPLKVADRLGRPMAILRMGGIVPLKGDDDPEFLNGSPPLLFPTSMPAPAGRRRGPHVDPEMMPAPSPLPAGKPVQPPKAVVPPAPMNIVPPAPKAIVPPAPKEVVPPEPKPMIAPPPAPMAPPPPPEGPDLMAPPPPPIPPKQQTGVFPESDA
ncbi:MAG: hypothetical protein K8T25_23275 [Planctomycetia bacterium]|nr:hypothetical protein [Planctomycetia bacterium]